MWGGFALGAMNFLFSAVTPQRRARCSAYLSFSSSSGVLVGSLVGGAALESELLFELLSSLGNGSELRGVFIFSSVLRLSCCVLGLRLFQEVVEHEPFSAKDFAIRIVHSRPFSSANFMPVFLRRNSTKKKDVEQITKF
jgi:MFS family permease